MRPLSPSTHRNPRDQGFDGARMCRRSGVHERSTPYHAQEIAFLAPRFLPYALRVSVDEVLDFRVRGGLLQLLQVPHEDALERRPVVAALGFAGFVEDEVRRGAQGGDGGVGDCEGCGDVVVGAGRGSGKVQLDEGAEDDALVIGPDGAVIVSAGRQV